MRGHGGMGYGWWRQIQVGDEKPKISWRLIQRVLSYARPFSTKIVLVLVTIIVSSVLGLASPLLFRKLIDDAIPNKNVHLLDLLAIGIIVIPLVDGVISVFQRWLNSSIGEGVIYQLRVALYAHLQHMSLRFFTNTKTGELMSRLNNDVVGAQTAISSTLVSIITDVFKVVATLAIMLALDWRLTLLGLLVLPLFIIPARQMGRPLRDIARQAMDINASMNAMMNETLNVSGALLVKLFGRNDGETQRFSERAGRVRDYGVRRAVLGSRLFVSLGLISAVGTFLVYWIGGHLVLDGVWKIGTLVAFGLYLGQIYGPLQDLVDSPIEFSTSMVSFERGFEILDMPLEIAEKADARPLKNIQGEVTFDHVSFNYNANADKVRLSAVERVGRMDNVVAVMSGDGTQNNAVGAPKSEAPESQARTVAIDDVSFTIKPGQLAALVGPSGAGKTTTTYLLPRLYDPTAGRILIDGIDLRDVTLTSLAEAIGMVTQETYLFHDTIRTNLLYAKPDATQDEIEAAARAANIHTFLAELPDGYDTIVRERGYRPCGGGKPPKH